MSDIFFLWSKIANNGQCYVCLWKFWELCRCFRHRNLIHDVRLIRYIVIPRCLMQVVFVRICVCCFVLNDCEQRKLLTFQRGISRAPGVLISTVAIYYDELTVTMQRGFFKECNPFWILLHAYDTYRYPLFALQHANVRVERTKVSKICL